jgi:hypothetical protein
MTAGNTMDSAKETKKLRFPPIYVGLMFRGHLDTTHMLLCTIFEGGPLPNSDSIETEFMQSGGYIIFKFIL